MLSLCAVLIAPVRFAVSLIASSAKYWLSLLPKESTPRPNMTDENSNELELPSTGTSRTPAEKVGPLALQLIEYVEEKYGSDAWVGSAIIVVDVIAADGEGHINPILVLSNDPRRWVQLALLQEACEQTEAQNEARKDRAEEVA